MDVKDAEMRQLKMSLKERDHDIAKANQMLLVTEETIDVSSHWSAGGSSFILLILITERLIGESF